MKIRVSIFTVAFSIKRKKKLTKLSNSPSELSEHVQQQKGWLHGSFLAIKVCVGQEKDKDSTIYQN